MNTRTPPTERQAFALLLDLLETSPSQSMEARALWARIIRSPHGLLPSAHNLQDKPLGMDAHRRFHRMASLLKDARPVPRLARFWGFYDDLFRITPSVLIPRSDTESLVEFLRIYLQQHTPNAHGDGMSVLDLATGSGCVGLSLAKLFPKLCLTLSDLSEHAVRCAQRNAHILGRSVEVIQHDGLKGLGIFDGIVANPPYLSPKDAHLPSLKHEPYMALVSNQKSSSQKNTKRENLGEDSGLGLIEAWSHEAQHHLKKGGFLLFEHAPNQGSTVRKLFASLGYESIQAVMDLAGRCRGTFGIHAKMPHQTPKKV